MANRKYTKEQVEFAKKLLRNSSLPRDGLPYTREFERLFTAYNKKFAKPDKHTFWKLLGRAGKEGGARLKKKPVSGSQIKTRPIPPLTQEDAFELLRLCPEGIGSRDRLPYTTEFDEMFRLFTQHTGTHLTKNAFWRSLSRLAKRSRKPQPIEYAPGNTVIPKQLEQHLFTMNPWWKSDPAKPIPDYKRPIYNSLYEDLTTGAYPIVSVRGPVRLGKRPCNSK
jgi:hypothetical protein